MSKAYDIVLSSARNVLLAATALAPDTSEAKIVRFGRGQVRCQQALEEAAALLPRDKPVVWVHAASLGEFSIARPIVRQIKKLTGCTMVVTFFSPTGYEALSARPMEEIDAMLYLPLDTARNAARFLDAIRPQAALFMVSEFWHNYLRELAERDIPTFLVSALIRDDSPFFKWYGGIYRRSLRTYARIFALDRRSIENLQRLGIGSGSLNGDPLFDNASLVASTPWDDPVIDRFTAGREVFIAGSIHPDQDLEMVTALANRHPDTKFLIVPHEISRKTSEALTGRLKGKTLFYTGVDASTPGLDEAQVLVIDFVGALAYIYRYGTWAYVGGGFTPFLHSVIEPVVYGLPVAFGPEIRRKLPPREMVELGIGTIVENTSQLDSWFRRLKSDRSALNFIRKKSLKYVSRNVGATTRVVDAVVKALALSSTPSPALSPDA